MEKTMTKKNVYAALINWVENDELTYEVEGETFEVTAEALKAFAENEIALLEKKAAKAKEAAKKKRTEADALMDAVKDALSDEFETIADITVRVEGEDVTVAKVTYRLNKLVDAGFAVKDEIAVPGEGKKTRKVKAYKRAAEEVAEE